MILAYLDPDGIWVVTAFVLWAIALTWAFLDRDDDR